MKQSITNHTANFIRHLWKTLKFLFVLVILTWAIKAAFFSVYKVPTISMAPTIQPGSYILVIKWPYQFRTPQNWPLTNIPFPFYSVKGPSKIQRGNIIVFDNLKPFGGTDYLGNIKLVKRCVGLKGDTIRIYPRKLKINSKVLGHRKNIILDLKADSLIFHLIVPNSKDYGYFVLGDNRTQSLDSRYFGTVPKKKLIGRAVAVIWPWPPRWL